MTQHKHVTPAPGLEPLIGLVGKWHLEGELQEGPFGPAGPFVSVDTYEWLEGGAFLIHRLDGRFGSRSAACVEVFGRRGDALVSQAYYNDGQERAWTVTARGDVLELNGSASGNDEEMREVRCELRVIEEGNALEALWTERQPGGSWREFFKARGTKALPLPNTSVGG